MISKRYFEVGHCTVLELTECSMETRGSGGEWGRPELLLLDPRFLRRTHMSCGTHVVYRHLATGCAGRRVSRTDRGTAQADLTM